MRDKLIPSGSATLPSQGGGAPVATIFGTHLRQYGLIYSDEIWYGNACGE